MGWTPTHPGLWTYMNRMVKSTLFFHLANRVTSTSTIAMFASTIMKCILLCKTYRFIIKIIMWSGHALHSIFGSKRNSFYVCERWHNRRFRIEKYVAASCMRTAKIPKQFSTRTRCTVSRFRSFKIKIIGHWNLPMYPIYEIVGTMCVVSST